jgi:polyvinyl alcohol dehydrogenase (cytochrome)
MAARILLCSLLVSAALDLRAQDGEAVYKKYCASCHDAAGARVPGRDLLRLMSPERILLALESGSMVMQGSFRTAAERRALSEFLAGKPLGSERASEPPREAFCKPADGAFKDPFRGPHWNGWGADLANSRFQRSDMAGLTAADVPRLKLKWAFGFPDDVVAYAQPSVAGGRLFVGSAGRKVYSLDPASGCIYWVFHAEAPVRNAISIGAVGAARYAAYFGDYHANVYAVDAASGELFWKTRVEDLPEARLTGAPTLHEGRLYVPVSSDEELSGADPAYECCRFRGSVLALDARTGKIVWKTYTIREPARPTRKNKVGTQLWGPSGVGVWSSPTIDVKRKVLYVGTGDSYTDPAAPNSDAILALALDSGKIVWARQITAGDAFNLGCRVPDKTNCPDARGPDFDFGSSPILVDLAGGRRALIAGQKSGMVHALDPDRRGRILWQTRVGKGGTLGGVQWGPAADLEKVYAAVSDLVARPTPMGLEADPSVGGGLHALRFATGEIAWSAPPPGCGDRKPCSPAQSAAVTVIPGVVFSGSSDGHLRAYSSETGKIVWDFDTVRDYQTVNGAKGRGGSLDGPGAVVVGGMVYVNSGYPKTGGIPGNVLLAFSVDGQ